MTTSGITSWPLTAGDVVTQAMYRLGELSEGETPSGEEMNDGLFWLNAMLKTWAGEANLFRDETAELSWLADQGEQTLSTDIRNVNNAWFVGSYNRILAEWNRTEYLSNPTPGSSGQPTAWYQETTPSGIVLHLWPVPSAPCLIALDYARKAYTVTDPAETLDIPEDWQEMAVLGLASRLADVLGTVATAPSLVARLDARATQTYQRLLDRDRPDSYTFEPDY